MPSFPVNPMPAENHCENKNEYHTNVLVWGVLD